MPRETALDIIEAEVKAGKLDHHYFEVFVKAKLFNPEGDLAHLEALVR